MAIFLKIFVCFNFSKRILKTMVNLGCFVWYKLYNVNPVHHVHFLNIFKGKNLIFISLGKIMYIVESYICVYWKYSGILFQNIWAFYIILKAFLWNIIAHFFLFLLFSSMTLSLPICTGQHTDIWNSLWSRGGSWSWKPCLICWLRRLTNDLPFWFLINFCKLYLNISSAFLLLFLK